jgi:hypothetical protein
MTTTAFRDDSQLARRRKTGIQFMAAYIFEENQADQELRRLRLIEQALDEDSFSRLRETGILPGWRCLELGAGVGSIARWLANVVAERRVETGAGRIWRYIHKPLGRLRKLK